MGDALRKAPVERRSSTGGPGRGGSEVLVPLRRPFFSDSMLVRGAGRGLGKDEEVSLRDGRVVEKRQYWKMMEEAAAARKGWAAMRKDGRALEAAAERQAVWRMAMAMLSIGRQW